MKAYDPNDPKQLPNWFDPYDQSHCVAYMELSRHGWWPPWFQDKMHQEGISTPDGWETLIRTKLAKAWLAHMLAEKE